MKKIFTASALAVAALSASPILTVPAFAQAKSVAVRDGRTLITDGPFPEFKEWFAGYDLVTADSIDEAAAFMAKHPVAVLGRIYILPLVELPWERD